MIGVLIRGVVRLVTKPQADKLVKMGRAQRIPTRGQATAQTEGKRVTTKEYNKLANIKPKVVKPKPKTPKYTTSAKNIKTTGGGARSPAGNVKVTTGGGKSKLPVVSGSRAVTTTGGKTVSKTGTGRLPALSLKGKPKPKGKLRKLVSKKAIVPLTAAALGVSTLGEKPKSDQTAQATTNGKKPPKPKPPKPDYTDVAGSTLTTLEDTALGENVVSKPKPKTFEQKLKDKWVKRRGGEEAFGKKGSEGAWKTHVLNMREGSDVGLSYTDQQNYDKIIAERKELAAASKGGTKKKRGGVIKRNKGGPVRGVGKALRGYGNNSIYSNKLY